MGTPLLRIPLCWITFVGQKLHVNAAMKFYSIISKEIIDPGGSKNKVC